MAAQRHVAHHETHFLGYMPGLFRGWEESKGRICLRACCNSGSFQRLSGPLAALDC